MKLYSYRCRGKINNRKEEKSEVGVGLVIGSAIFSNPMSPVLFIRT